MKQNNQPFKPQSSDEYTYQDSKNSQMQDEETIDTCMMDPCPMKMMPKNDRPLKCPDCGKMTKAFMISRNTISPGNE